MKKKSSAPQFAGMPDEGMPALNPDPSVTEAVGDVQRLSGTWIYTTELPAAERRTIERLGRKHARAGAAGIKDDGCAWGVYLTSCYERCVSDINLNIRHFYAQTLPWVRNIIVSAHNLAAPAPPAPERPAQGDTWGRQQERRRRSAAQQHVDRLERERAALEGYLAAYRTARLELERAAVSCQAAYGERASCYMDAVVRMARWPRLLGGARVQIPEGALEHLQFPEVEVGLPDDAFGGMSGDELIAHAGELRLPAAYVDLAARVAA